MHERIQLLDFDESAITLLYVHEFWLRGDLFPRRANIVGFASSLPRLFFECNNCHFESTT